MIKDNKARNKSEFMEQLSEKWIKVGSLKTATIFNMDGRVQLADSYEYLESMLDTLKTAADFQAAGKNL